MTLFEHLQTCSIFEMADFIDELLTAREERIEKLVQDANVDIVLTKYTLAPAIRQKKLVDELMKEVGDGNA